MRNFFICKLTKSFIRVWTTAADSPNTTAGVSYLNAAICNSCVCFKHNSRSELYPCSCTRQLYLLQIQQPEWVISMQAVSASNTTAIVSYIHAAVHDSCICFKYNSLSELSPCRCIGQLLLFQTEGSEWVVPVQQLFHTRRQNIQWPLTRPLVHLLPPSPRCHRWRYITRK